MSKFPESVEFIANPDARNRYNRDDNTQYFYGTLFIDGAEFPWHISASDGVTITDLEGFAEINLSILVSSDRVTVMSASLKADEEIKRLEADES